MVPSFLLYRYAWYLKCNLADTNSFFVTLFRNDLIFQGIGLSNTGYLTNLNKVLILRFENMADHALELQYDAVLKSAKIIFNHTSAYSFKLNLVSILLRSNHVNYLELSFDYATLYCKRGMTSSLMLFQMNIHHTKQYVQIHLLWYCKLARQFVERYRLAGRDLVI